MTLQTYSYHDFPKSIYLRKKDGILSWTTQPDKIPEGDVFRHYCLVEDADSPYNDIAIDPTEELIALGVSTLKAMRTVFYMGVVIYVGVPALSVLIDWLLEI